MSGAKRSIPSKPAGRTSRTSFRRRRRESRWFLRIFLGAFGVVAILLAWAIAARAFAPKANTSRPTFDAILILGTPADADGNPTPEMQDRVREGVREYERGVAPRLIVTGGAAHNRFVEAEVMSHLAQAQGVPSSVIFEERRAQDTIQNACYSAQILKAHGWHSVEVVSSASHLPRAAMIFSGFPLEWRMHAAAGTQTPAWYRNASIVAEVLKTARYLVWARWTETCS